jgi:DNA-binding IclR family transcriptional regulator
VAITTPTTLADKIEAQLVRAGAPLTATALRKLCHIRNATLTTALTDLVAAGRVRKDPTGYVIGTCPFALRCCTTQSHRCP